MNKQDVLIILEAIASDDYFKDYQIRKSDNSIIYKTANGYKRVRLVYYNSFDLERKDLALEIQPHYEVRFNVLHKWFEKYSKRELKYQRDDDSVRFWGAKLGLVDEYYFLENRNYYEEDLNRMKVDVINNARDLLEKYSSLECCYQYLVDDEMKGNHPLPYIGIEWFFERLILARIIAPQNYDAVKQFFLKRLDEMIGWKEPNIMMYYNDLPMILEDLENTDFGSGNIII